MVSVPDTAWTYEDLDVDGLDLREPLRESAALLAGAAAALCGDCAWYHGSWQHLRLLDLVATPARHHDFFQASLRAAVARGARRFLVAGTADYSVLAYVLDALGPAAASASVTVVDRCETPLQACRWYARRSGAEIITVTADVVAYALGAAGTADVVVTDGFLTRDAIDRSRKVVRAWATVLAPGGTVITTVRTHGDAAPETEPAIREYRARAEAGRRRWDDALPADIGERAERYARRGIGEPVGDAGDIMRLVGTALTVERAELAVVPGELSPAKYLRMNLSARG